MKKIFFVILCCFIQSCVAQVDEIRIPKTKSETVDMPNYFPEHALRLALEKTQATHGLFTITYVNGEHSPQRLRSMLLNTDMLDVMWSTSTKERENLLLPVRFNILKGINAYRRLLIHADSQPEFDKVKSLSDLQKLQAGVGLYWSDIDVLSQNGLRHSISPTYDSTIKMLAAKRFDYVMRGAQEIDDETLRYKDLNLVAEKNIYVHYCLPVFFFVKKENTALAQRIQAGLEMAVADGSLDQLFFSVPTYKKVFTEIHAKDSKKVLIELSNSNCDASN